MKLPPLTDDVWPSGLEHLRQGFAGRLNVYRVMAHHPALLASWEAFRNHVVLNSALSAQDRELVILRAAYTWKVAYEWAHHVERGQAAGLTDSDIAAVQRGPQDGHWSDARRMLLRVADDIVATGALTPPLRDAVDTYLTKECILDIIATIGLYRILAGLIVTFDVPLETGFSKAAADPPEWGLSLNK